MANRGEDALFAGTMMDGPTTDMDAVQLMYLDGNQDSNEYSEYQIYWNDAHHVMDNYAMVRASDFDTCILASSDRGMGVKAEIHIWITPSDFDNANLMILLGYVILGHPQWKKAEIKIFAIVHKSELAEQKEELLALIKAGRLPISAHNVLIIEKSQDVDNRQIINEHSCDADLTILGFRSEAVKQLGNEIFADYDEIGDVLFVNSTKSKEIK
jgi:hypothetical protein